MGNCIMFGIDDAIAQGTKLIDDVVTRIWPDATEIEKAKLAQTAQEIQNQYSVILGQLDVNKAEAQNPHVFVAGARPYILWGLGTSLIMAANYWFISWIALCFGLPPVPVPDTGMASAIVTTLLGVAGLRSYDKAKGTDTKRIGK